jgi:glutaminyl-tRNA synthetase
MAVINPLKLVITNYPEGQVEELDAENNPEDKSLGNRKVPFSKELFIDHDDFMEDAPKKWFRLAPGKEVRLKHAYYVTCNEVIKDAEGNVIEVRCTYDPDSRGGWTDDGRKVMGTLHWVSCQHAFEAEVRVYDNLFTTDDPYDVEEGQDYLDNLNPDSLVVVPNAKLEPALESAEPGQFFQFLRLGYFCCDSEDSRVGKPVFNRTVTLRDTWAKIVKKQKSS